MKTREKGRKKKDEGLVKETRVGFRLSPEELIELERLVYNAEAKNRTEYIKAAIFRREIRVTKVEEKKALAFLYKLENITIELVNLNKEIIELTKKIEKEWLQK